MRRNVVALAITCAALGSPSTDAQGTGSLSQADGRKIEEAEQAAVKAALAKDFDAWSALFMTDGAVYPPNEPPVQGREAIRAWMEKLPPITEFTLKSAKVDGRGDLAYVMGAYTMTFAPPGAPGPVKDSGKYVTVLRRQADGRWLAVVDMFSSDQPPAMPGK
jgi:uncharacterized protein (TIGR02246 family)